MTNLETKFETLEAQLATQHTAIGNALDALLTALGVPPPTSTVTLGDTVDLMIAMNNNLIGMAIAQGSFHTALLEAVNTIAVNTDLIINNNSLNAQRTIAAIYATFCDCGTDNPLLAPPIDVTPTSLVDEAKCRRIQFYLSVFGNWLDKIANYGASGAAITGGTIATLLSGVALDAGIIATGVEVGAAGGPPGIIIGAVVGLLAVVVYTLGGSVLIDYANQFNDPTLRDNMVQAMYAATTAEEGYAAFKATLLAGMDDIPAEIIYTLWWSAWSNDVYSGSPVVDDSAFDGSICVASEVLECFSSTAEQVTIGGYLRWVVLAPTSCVGWTVRVESGGAGVSVYGDASDPTLTIGASLYTLTEADISAGQNAFWFSREFGGAYTLRFCPPGVTE